MKFEFEPNITKEYLLSKARQETYLEYYLGIPVKKGLFKSPLRDDKNPTCAFYVNASGDIIFKDFSGQFNGNFINVVMFKYNCSYYKALRIIANDFGYCNYSKLPKCSKPIKVSEHTFEGSKEAIIQVEIQDFSDFELDWWKQYGITEKILKKFRVFSCKTVFLNGNVYIHSSYRHPIFGYYRGKNDNKLELWRIYFPNHRSREPKFLSNWKSILLQGSKQLPKEGDILVITKSMKDVMCLYSLGITAIAPNSENLFLTENQYNKLKKRFKRIVLFYDNDLPGIHNMNKIRKKFNIECMWIPRKYKAKDISDFYKIYGEDRTKELIEYARGN
jgi:hypothetical protein